MHARTHTVTLSQVHIHAHTLSLSLTLTQAEPCQFRQGLAHYKEASLWNSGNDRPIQSQASVLRLLPFFFYYFIYYFYSRPLCFKWNLNCPPLLKKNLSLASPLCFLFCLPPDNALCLLLFAPATFHAGPFGWWSTGKISSVRFLFCVPNGTLLPFILHYF